MELKSDLFSPVKENDLGACGIHIYQNGVLGRVASGKGGDIIINQANRVIREEFPDLYGKINITTPEENSMCIGQSLTAASLPRI